MIAALTAFSGFAVASDDNNNLFEQHKNNIYVGAGMGSYSLGSFDDSFSYQLVAGYNLDYKLKDYNEISFAVEAGYAQADWEKTVSGYVYTTRYSYKVSTEMSSFWGALVANYPINDKFTTGVSLGYDLGDDDGLMYGINGTYKVHPLFDVRADYLIRQNVNALTANVIYKF